MLSILTYSLCSLGSGFSTSIVVLIAFRFVLGLGMGGEWNTGATLVAETWPTHLRARAIAIVQKRVGVGLAAAAVVAWVVLDKLHQNWRFVFFVGVLPALVTLWISEACLNPRCGSSTKTRRRQKRHSQKCSHRALRKNDDLFFFC